ncbi:MAG: 3-methyl-2-oxobutanoate hydroxymethyltransferase [Luteitalea sp.]|nr:3-methyl-2-oxobutanoate hydroxymethyltransferase [Luteitalea sp.]
MTTHPPRPVPDRPVHDTPARAKLSLPELAELKRRGQRIAMVTAYDAPSARLAETADVELVLVGDSAAMTMLGHDTTLPVTVDEMLMLTRAVTRGAQRPIIVADLPFGSFQISDEAAIAHAVRFVKEARADAVKLEGAGLMLSRVRAIVGAGVPVMGHIGLTPQSAVQLGGLKAQGRTAQAASRFYQDALALQRAGCFALVVEAVPAAVAAHITEALTIPTIGIGAGAACDGQVLVWHDLLGLSSGRVPRFVKQYADLSGRILEALEAYVADVRAGTFPTTQHTYAISAEELERFESGLPPSRR